MFAFETPGPAGPDDRSSLYRNFVPAVSSGSGLGPPLMEIYSKDAVAGAP